MLPRPYSRALRALLKLAVCVLLCVHERNVSVVHLGFLVHKREDTFCSRKSHNNGVYLLRKLVYVARKLLCHIKERNNNADTQRLPREADVRCLCNKQKSADNSGKNV